MACRWPSLFPSEAAANAPSWWTAMADFNSIFRSSKRLPGSSFPSSSSCLITTGMPLSAHRKRDILASPVSAPDLGKIAAAYNIPCIVIENQKHLHEDVRRALEMAGPVMVDVRVIPDEVRAPRLQSYQRPDGSFVSKPLEDLFPFLPREEFLANMIAKPLDE